MLRSATWQLGARAPRGLPQGISCCIRQSPCLRTTDRYSTVSTLIKRPNDASSVRYPRDGNRNAVRARAPGKTRPEDEDDGRLKQIERRKAQTQAWNETSTQVFDRGSAQGPRHYEKRRRPVKRERLDQLLRGVLESKDALEWKKKAAAMTSQKLHVVILQILIRKEVCEKDDHSSLHDLLCDDGTWETTLQQTAAAAGCTQEDLHNWANILEPKSDNERCDRFLEQKRAVPLFILVHILRHSSTLEDCATLSRLIEVFHTSVRAEAEAEPVEEGDLGPKLTTQNMNPNEYSMFVAMLAHHCVRLEPRLLVNLANAVAFYVESYEHHSRTDAAFQGRCKLFNDALVAFRPQSRLHAEQAVLPNAYFWEAQRILLSKSDSLKKPLLVEARGFRAIRDVLAGMPKSGAEIHNSLRHAPTWPPYLRPGDGIDERTDPEDNWGRAVGAGMLMQEAGYAKDESDEALDILQGMAPDGTPTIQQRTASGDWRRAGAWEACIRATRNAQEAWSRFLSPPATGSIAGLDEYAAMFEKLVLPEAKSDSGTLPGDKAVNFPVHRQANLADIEWARQHPPSVSQLYNQMRLNGLHPTGHCLHILVANAESVDLANKYLTDAAVQNEAYRCLVSDLDSPMLRDVDMGLIAAYIHLLLRADGKRAWKHFRRALRLATLRLDDRRSRWVPLIWGPILKSLSQHHHGLRISLAEQVTLLSQITQRIEKGHRMTITTFSQLSKCTKKIIRRELKPTAEELQSPRLQRSSVLNLYKKSDDSVPRGDGTRVFDKPQSKLEGDHGTVPLFQKLGEELKANFRKLQNEEQSASECIRHNDIAPLDYMATRRDPVRREHALEYMTALAFAGEFREMQSVLQWLIDEWGKPELIEAIEALDEPPSYADFFEVLCVFRLFAEPMLDAREVAALQRSIGARGLTWTWPGDEAAESYLQMQVDESLLRLRNVVLWMQPQRQE